MNRRRLNFSTSQLLNFFIILSSAFLLFACAGSPHPQLISPSEGPPSRRQIELLHDKQIATLHFPAGIYTLSAADKIGYYYRAPRKIREGGVWLDGGIFVSKRDPQKLRGYVYRLGTITHVGNFSHAPYRFIGEDIPASDH